jgi:2-oxoglutarate ferredoxin oxidoreductase subunit alpha
MAREAGLKVGLMRPITLFPFPAHVYLALSQRCKRFLDIELSTGQMIDDVRLSVARDADVAFYGRPPGAGSLPTPEEIYQQIRKVYP